VELWLEMKLPNPQARAEILSALLAGLPEELRGADAPRLVAATEGFTGADLKAMVEDGKAIFAYDRPTMWNPNPPPNTSSEPSLRCKRTNSITPPPKPRHSCSPNLPWPGSCALL